MAAERDCCFQCRACSRVHCAQADTSPGEVDNLCPPCWLTDDPDQRTDDELLADFYRQGFAS